MRLGLVLTMKYLTLAINFVTFFVLLVFVCFPGRGFIVYVVVCLFY